jgi:hypothetical protein
VLDDTDVQNSQQLVVKPIEPSADRIDFELRRQVVDNLIKEFTVRRPDGSTSNTYHENLLTATCSSDLFALLKDKAWLICEAEIEFISPSGKADSIMFPEMKLAMERGSAQTQNNEVTFQLKLAAEDLEMFLASNNSDPAATPGAKPLSLRDFLTTVVLPNNEHVRVAVKLVKPRLRFSELIDSTEKTAEFPVASNKSLFLYLKAYKIGTP